MSQDARVRRLSLFFLAACTAAGCQSTPKPPPQPLTIYNPPPKPPAPVGTTISTTPSQPPIVNGAPLNAAPVMPLPTAPGRTVPPMNVPTIPGANPISSNAPSPDRGQSILPPTPPEVSGIAAPPVSTTLMEPTSLHP